MRFTEVDSVVEELRGQVRELQDKIDELSKMYTLYLATIMLSDR